MKVVKITSSFFSQSQDLINWISLHGDPSNVRNLNGVIPAYPIFMFIGIILVIVASIIKMKTKRIPLRELELAIVITVPLGILGATIFGKAFIPGLVWYHVFFFWEPGMSLFGALGLGVAAGFVWFYRRSKVTMISVWVYADCILPNILLGQIIGRWGNMYNHEILGQVVSYESLGWLIGSIRDQLFYFPSELATLALPNGWGEIVANHGSNLDEAIQALIDAGLPSDQGETMKNLLTQPLQYREPLFLYESLSNSCLWLILTFIVPNLSRWFQPPLKYPWDVEPKAYPGWYNKKYKHLPESEISSMNSQKPIKYQRVLVGDDQTPELKLSFFNAWNKAYYWYESDEAETEKLLASQEQRSEKIQQVYQRVEGLSQQKTKRQNQAKQRFLNQSHQYDKGNAQFKKAKTTYHQELRTNRVEYQKAKQTQLASLGGFKRHFAANPDAKYLEQVNNPNHFWILRSGVISGGYLFGYLLIRIILETHRQASELFIQNTPIADYLVLSLILFLGIVLIVFAQGISPYKWRMVGWLYEKSY
ncbi:Prolipoprotein diacylglyceryl transferase [Mesoplasma sp. JKS002658]|uniref:prolipoprotein diacylglyceryl transferase family protein n=1 Tax=Mesoplasma whartonense TaxID=2878854 RepID=UPI002022A254|nr:MULTISPECIES: prolipoprotein diacylglyceryl transferase family protein [unclassified Mesoplasma]MCL8211714.1 Prolipoprotein diacylglyceryl transferase [Mesoplasma sp. JKS002664]MCL8212091.1 Prolipoprotein diacylglyceryl transferase [Mesoplasma sp. JKS002662]MCL8213804.1 Prolipoprotein diacylglyceryl transferase [Mesoplasma sp. JKS002658]MCL8215050.1 Prolipoprotein diacylglyceryl transferase [Mesoplasma sp. JKS002663]MCL8215123.1 Prolipoprotein diacylglyceryl transferase [Mesoplasma sp. JKS0